jgi:hypothetical protein
VGAEQHQLNALQITPDPICYTSLIRTYLDNIYNLKTITMQKIKYNKSKQTYTISTLSKNKQIINLEILTKLNNKTQKLLNLNNNWQTTSFLPNYVKINNDYYLQEFDFEYVD